MPCLNIVQQRWGVTRAVPSDFSCLGELVTAYGHMGERAKQVDFGPSCRQSADKLEKRVLTAEWLAERRPLRRKLYADRGCPGLVARESSRAETQPRTGSRQRQPNGVGRGEESRGTSSRSRNAAGRPSQCWRRSRSPAAPVEQLFSERAAVEVAGRELVHLVEAAEEVRKEGRAGSAVLPLQGASPCCFKPCFATAWMWTSSGRHPRND